ncbi:MULTISPECIES: preprotein translocase subunit YajC [Acidiphilium]|jgi:preprotein translocase subunit YajC|uniref:Sec translocon accessory complex subunit YajC n=1 Tax=Acidiphilium rubrum TaxID=526 RepID=A0A8G2CKH9_ACIRU|nr:MULTISPECIES: preprotein translocase subunit YajC [Acidiphilium]MBW4036385.1 preprotein translocase subunit YajC [Pseudomonadota bacterium]OYW03793.1 MAG: preprotein translocase subunit YajC [Acidiphilium sp. 37-64-53]OZB28821.1 MAG: preprotein translocase subunit YajC [Acidiphilium sp. 34-64-41]SIQ77554.1 protein translocase subunit yajC [Acidiphilium rubrum]HQT83522.1 preprotein translocase subunit YajC [Acidiphilium rubrum]
MFIATAYAADAAPAAGGMSAIFSFAPLVLIVIVFYFILIRPQQQQAKALKGRLAGIRRGDKVVTGGGFIGQVAKAVDGAEEIEVDIAPNVRVTVLRSTISTVLTETKPDAKIAEVKKPAK